MLCPTYLVLFVLKINEILFQESVCVLESPPLSTDQAVAFLTYLILGVIVGGRLGYVFFYNLEYYSSDLSLLFECGTVVWLFMADLSAL